MFIHLLLFLLGILIFILFTITYFFSSYSEIIFVIILFLQYRNNYII